MESFEISENFNAPRNVVYEALLDSVGHGDIIGEHAEIRNRVDAPFRIWDGYITGRNLELVPNTRILQAWRTTEFPAGAPDSTVETLFERTDEGCRVTIRHSGIPDGQGDGYRKGWADFYFKPMRKYFKGRKD